MVSCVVGNGNGQVGRLLTVGMQKVIRSSDGSLVT